MGEPNRDRLLQFSVAEDLGAEGIQEKSACVDPTEDTRDGPHLCLAGVWLLQMEDANG